MSYYESIHWRALQTMVADDDLDVCQVPYAALTVNSIQNAINSACIRASSKVTDDSSDSNSDTGGWVWDRWNTDDQKQGRLSSLLHGFIGTQKYNASALNENDIYTITFYFAYSTWDGRILYIDRLVDTKDVSVSFAVYQILADIATQLHCRRYDPLITSILLLQSGNIITDF